MPKKKIKNKKKKNSIIIPNSYKVEKINYDKIRHETSVDQSDRLVP